MRERARGKRNLSARAPFEKCSGSEGERRWRGRWRSREAAVRKKQVGRFWRELQREGETANEERVAWVRERAERVEVSREKGRYERERKARRVGRGAITTGAARG